ncbi:MAG TPA: hypothetical protein VGA08_00525, partial [Candidatus Saccharimonadales bacterium]
RSITIGSSEAGATNVTYDIQFDIPNTDVGSFRVSFCDGDPLPNTNCVLDGTGDDVPDLDSVTLDSAALSGASSCTVISLEAITPGDNFLDFTCNVAETGSTGTFTATVDGVVNPDNSTDGGSDNNSFYARLYTFTATTPTAYSLTPEPAGNNDGGIALSTAEQLTITARVQEILQFCVGTNATGPNECSGMTGNAVDMGVLDFAQVNRATTQASPSQGSVWVRTNAANGVVVDYFAEQAGTGTNHLGALRVSGASCNAGDVETDQCIKSVGTAQTPIVAGTEEFGMCAFNIDYTGQDVGTATTGLDLDTEYDGACDNSGGNGYAFDESGSTDRIADSSLSGGVVNDEMIELDFAGTSAITTPTGLYTVTLTFIGTATF